MSEEEQQKLEIDMIYDIFQDDHGYLDREEFLEVLQESNLVSNCSLLVDRIRRHPTPKISKQEFSQAFSVDLTKRTEYDEVYDLIKKHNLGEDFTRSQFEDMLHHFELLPDVQVIHGIFEQAQDPLLVEGTISRNSLFKALQINGKHIDHSDTLNK